MRQAHIFYKDQLAGILTENDAGYEFCYLPEYLWLQHFLHQSHFFALLSHPVK